jgi:hypothetical protein
MRKALLAVAASVSVLAAIGLSAGVASAAPSPPPPSNAGCIPRTIANFGGAPSGAPGAAVVSSGQRGLELVQGGVVGGIVAAATTPHDACL